MIKKVNNKTLFILWLCLICTACSNKKTNKKTQAPHVTVTQVKQQDVPIYVDAIGQVIPPVTVFIRPQVAGKLIKTYIQQGSIVNEGDVLYEMDPRPYLAILSQAKAQLAHDQALLVYAE